MTTSISGTSGITFPNGSNQDVGAVGVGQTWQDVTASRSFNTTYTNDTGKPIMVSACGDNAVPFTIYVNGVTIGSCGNMNLPAVVIVPNGQTYRIDCSGTKRSWAELR